MKNTEHEINNRLLLVSLPKSGTYFISEILRNLGFQQSFLHLNLEFYEDYSTAALGTARSSPLDFRIQEKLIVALGRIGADSFAVGHLPASNRMLAKGGMDRHRILSQFKVIFLVRDLRRCMVSHMNFEIYMRNQHQSLKDLPVREQLVGFLKLREKFLFETYKRLIPWCWQQGVTVVRYEEITGGVAQSFIGFKGERLHQAIEAAKVAKTLTKSDRNSDPNRHWSEEAEKIYGKRMRGLNRALGYDLEYTGYPGLKSRVLKSFQKMQFDLGEMISGLSGT